MASREKARYDCTLYLIRNRTQTGCDIPTKDFAFDECTAAGGHAMKSMAGPTNGRVKAGLREKEPAFLMLEQDKLQRCP